MVKKLVSLVNIICLLSLGISLYPDNNVDVAQGNFGELMINPVAVDRSGEYTHLAALEDRRGAAALGDLGLNISLDGEMTGRDFPVSRSLTHCKAVVNKTLRALPKAHIDPLRFLTLRMIDEGSRGLGGSNIIFLRCLGVTDEELVGVLVHEIGHIVDLGMVKGNFYTGNSGFTDGSSPIYNDDTSLEFYRISWKESKTKRDNIERGDFVTGYATTDPFEDFAESYIMYTLHGSEFRTMARDNDVLQQKYDYIKKYIFQENEFTSLVGNGSQNDRVYDSTLIPYDMMKFLET